MRSYFGAIGMPISSGSGNFVSPARELFANTMDKYQGELAEVIRKEAEGTLTK
jgi:hypothetical protein